MQYDSLIRMTNLSKVPGWATLCGSPILDESAPAGRDRPSLGTYILKQHSVIVSCIVDGYTEIKALMTYNVVTVVTCRKLLFLEPWLSERELLFVRELPSVSAFFPLSLSTSEVLRGDTVSSCMLELLKSSSAVLTVRGAKRIV